MSRARPIFPNTTYLETLRTLSRELLFVGEDDEQREEIRRIFLYSLAHAANKYDIEIHGYVLMGNHPHLEYTDTDGHDPKFRQLKNSLVARAMNALRGRRGPFWSPDRCVQVLADEAAQTESYAYLMANPVKHGIVENAADYPGLRSSPWDIGTTLMIERPRSLYRSMNLPEVVPLRLTMPPALRARLRHEAFAALHEAVAKCEQSFRAAREAKGLGYLGADRALRSRPTDRPDDENEGDDEGAPTPTNRPHYIKCFDPRLRRMLKKQLRAFREAHHEAWERFLDDDEDTRFPFGTWRMKELFGVPVETPPTIRGWTS